jgi:hypothetical protein
MLPGFNNNDVFMAVEGFTAGQHNRSDEAFTIADLEEFEAANSVSSETTTTKAFISTNAKASTNATASTNAIASTNATTTTKPNPSSSKTNPSLPKPKPSLPKPKPKPSLPKPKPKPSLPKPKPSLPKPKPSTDRDTEEEVDQFKDLDPEVEDEMEDPEMDETAETDMINEEPEPVAEEEDTNQDMEMTFETEKPADLEGFTGSRVVSEKWLNSLLKTILLVFVGYVLFHPSTAKVMAKNFGNTGLSRDLVICAVFFIICYIILVSF